MSGQPLRDRPYDPAVHGSQAIPDYNRPRPSNPQNPPPGWTIAYNELVSDETIDGYLARGETDVYGICYADHCRRRCTIDFKDLKRRQLGGMSMGLVQRLLRCSSIDNCRLKFGDGSARQIRIELAFLNGRPNVRVKLFCDYCKFFILAKPAKLIAKLVADGRGGADTLVSQLPLLTAAPCSRCGRKAWRAGVLWHDTDTIGWRERGERVFDAMRPPKPPPGLMIEKGGGKP